MQNSANKSSTHKKGQITITLVVSYLQSINSQLHRESNQFRKHKTTTSHI